jgi:hypothetical protein
MEYMQLSLDDYIQCKNDIKNNLGTIVKSFVRIGWQLSRTFEVDASRFAKRLIFTIIHSLCIYILVSRQLH